jgi:hypothetical protein
VSADTLTVALPGYDVEATVELSRERAPVVCASILATLGVPVRASATHACFDGHAIFCFLPNVGSVPVQNCTMRPMPGDVMLYQAGVNFFDWLHEDAARLSPLGTDQVATELSFI